MTWLVDRSLTNSIPLCIFLPVAVRSFPAVVIPLCHVFVTVVDSIRLNSVLSLIIQRPHGPNFQFNTVLQNNERSSGKHRIPLLLTSSPPFPNAYPEHRQTQLSRRSKPRFLPIFPILIPASSCITHHTSCSPAFPIHRFHQYGDQ